METSAAVAVLGALAQPARLELVRLLARLAPRALRAGELAEALAIPAPTLSFHLQRLLTAELVSVERHGRELRYALRADTWRALHWFLGEECAQGRRALAPDPLERVAAQQAAAVEESPSRELVLFVCTENRARSPLAEALLRHLGGARFEAQSAGLRPGTLHPLTRAVLREDGIDTRGLRSKDLSELLGKRALHRVIVVCPFAAERADELAPSAARLELWPLADPAAVRGSKETQLAAFRATRDELRTRLHTWIEEN
ncbi:MAG: metalloregulator ArsR/SmtB family transcription factor [Planctomycetes bacterium]|nr:metalloregulator ArsR/SmtB family transcription factor [Planctomycetota bacterium]